MSEYKKPLLDKINKANDIKRINRNDWGFLAREIRHFLVENVSNTGGHLASNLGVVELTMALHLALDLPEDQIIWDVGHQSYVHKILTGRKNEFDTLRQYGGLSGFPKRRENECDAFNTGHSSTSVSVAIGLATAKQTLGKKGTVVAVIGDGALTGGMAYEALNNASKLNRNMIIILNDNKMSISENVGGVSSYLSTIRAGEKYNNLKEDVVRKLESFTKNGDKMVRNIKRTKDNFKRIFVPDNIFEDMGITYLGPIDGHNCEMMRRIILEAKKIDHPVLIHVCTKKGKGYSPAEKNTEKFHGIGKFDPKTGNVFGSSKQTYTHIFADALLECAESNDSIVAITAAMESGTGLKKFHQRFPDRFHDVGIAEEHAVTFAAGMAAGGLKPFVAIYSSFLQRAYDQILHDVCIQSLPVTFCVDRAGLVGEDGETHQGIFDLSFLQTIPGMNIIAPKNGWELAEAIKFASGFNGPLAIRYPRGEACTEFEEFKEPFEFGKSEVLYKEKEIAIIAAGSMVSTGAIVRERLIEQGHNVSLVNIRFIKPVDEEMLRMVAEYHGTVVTIEENVLAGGMGMTILKHMSEINRNVKVINFAIPNHFVEQGSHNAQIKESGLDADAITEKLCKMLADK